MYISRRWWNVCTCRSFPGMAVYVPDRFLSVRGTTLSQEFLIECLSMSGRNTVYSSIASLLCVLLLPAFLYAQAKPLTPKDTVDPRKLMEDAEVRSERQDLSLSIRNVDISHFPEVSIIVEAFNKQGIPLDTLRAEDVSVMENGREKRVISVQKITVNERVLVDFVFVIDVTGSMQNYINGVRNNISNFTASLVRRGIDYQIGLVLFSDVIEKTYEPTGNVIDFMQWLATVRASGGLDEKENALEALATVTKMKFRPAANRVAVLITDAPYHQKGDVGGNGVTGLTTKTAIELLTNKDIRVFGMVPEKLEEYQKIAHKTRGTVFELQQSFATILDNFSNQLTNLYALKYRSDEEMLPDSIEIGIVDWKKTQLVKQTIPIIEIGRKLIIENLLYPVNSAVLADSVGELERIGDFLKRKPNVTIQVEGHTDSQGNDAANLKLSKLRAESVKNYLVKKGIDSERVKTVGYGESRPIASNATDFGRQLNRRTEIIIIDR